METPAGLEKRATFTFNRGARKESTLCSLYEGLTREQGLSKEENDKEAAEGLQAGMRSLIHDKTDALQPLRSVERVCQSIRQQNEVMMGTDVAEIQKEGDTDKFRQGRKGKGVNVRKAADGEARVATEAETVFENQRTMRREVLGSESSRSLRGEKLVRDERQEEEKHDVSRGLIGRTGSERNTADSRGGEPGGEEEVGQQMGGRQQKRPREQVGLTCRHLLGVLINGK